MDVYRDYREDPTFHHLKYGSKFVGGRGSTRPLVAFVGDVPTLEESAAGKVLVGQERLILHDMLKAIDLKPEHVFYTNVLKYRPHGGRDPRHGEVFPSMEYMWDEMAIIQPKIIVPLGRYATGVFFDGYSFADMCGEAVEGGEGEYHYVCLNGLSNVLHNPLLRQEQIINMNKISQLL